MDEFEQSALMANDSCNTFYQNTVQLEERDSNAFIKNNYRCILFKSQSSWLMQ